MKIYNMSIPTIGCKGIQFRSRIEAQWSFIFEQLGYNWEYEPDVNLYMYIPDFIITFPDGNELLVEIKSIVNIWNKDKEYTIHANKIIRSGWTKDFVILGSNYKAINGLTKIGSLHTDSKKYDAFLHLKNDQWCLYGETQHDESIHEKFETIFNGKDQVI